MNTQFFANGLGFCRLCAQVRADIGQDHRYAHSVRVARLAERLAHRHGIDTRQARIAGMLHDLARLWSAERLLTASAEYGIAVDPFERANPIVLHAPIGAILAREKYQVDDPAILQAITRHTLAAPDMTPLDTVVFLADALEPGRDFAEREEFVALALRDLQAAQIAVYSSTQRYLKRRGLPLAPAIAAALRPQERTEL